MEWVIGGPGVYVSYLEPFVDAPNIMWAGGAAAIGFGIWNLTHGNDKGGVAQIILGSIAVIGSFFVR